MNRRSFLGVVGVLGISMGSGCLGGIQTGKLQLQVENTSDVTKSVTIKAANSGMDVLDIKLDLGPGESESVETDLSLTDVELVIAVDGSSSDRLPYEVNKRVCYNPTVEISIDRTNSIVARTRNCL